jgi:hypothetical protein
MIGLKLQLLGSNSNAHPEEIPEVTQSKFFVGFFQSEKDKGKRRSLT